MEPLERSAATALESSLFGLVNFTARSCRTVTVAYLHIKPEVVGVSRPYCRCINAVQIFQRQHVSASGSISVPSEIKASLLRAFQAKKETHVNLLVTHSYLLTSTQHLFIYCTIISIFTDTRGPVDSPEVSIPFASFACCTFTRTPPFSQDGCKQRAKHVVLFFFQQVYQVSGQ